MLITWFKKSGHLNFCFCCSKRRNSSSGSGSGGSGRSSRIVVVVAAAAVLVIVVVVVVAVAVAAVVAVEKGVWVLGLQLGLLLNPFWMDCPASSSKMTRNIMETMPPRQKSDRRIREGPRPRLGTLDCKHLVETTPLESQVSLIT